MNLAEIHIWGDSLARGVIYNEEKGRYAISGERCVNRLEKQLGCAVKNHSVMGATVEDGLAAFGKAAPAPEAICAIEFGGNDCDLNWKSVSENPNAPIQAKVPLNVYKEKLATFVSQAKQSGMTPVLVTPLPLHAPRYFEWVTRGLDRDNVRKALGDVEHIYRWQERYTIAMRQVARELQCCLLDTRDEFLSLNHYEDYICLDGIHPNDKGHKAVSDWILAQA